MRKLIVASLLITASALVMAKLPPPSDEAKAKAAEAAAKAAWSGKVDAYRSCVAQDKVAAHYYQTAKAANKDAKPPQATPPCADPGAFAYTPAEVVKPRRPLARIRQRLRPPVPPAAKHRPRQLLPPKSPDDAIAFKKPDHQVAGCLL